MKTLDVLSALLHYPGAELQAAAGELKVALYADRILPAHALHAVVSLIDEIALRDIHDAQERYILLFDRTRSLSLHLFAHLNGECRDRGQAMVDLHRLYEIGGFTPARKELPDYLPLFLEYAATRGPAEAIELIGQLAHVFAALRERLAKRGSGYAAVFAALAALGNAKLDQEALRAEPNAGSDDFEALDAAWDEEAVTYGPSIATVVCGKDTRTAQLRQASRPAPGLEPAPGTSPRMRFITSTTRF